MERLIKTYAKNQKNKNMKNWTEELNWRIEIW